MKQDLQCEWAFYSRELNVIGMLYLRGTKMACKEPDLLFFALYTCGLLVDRKLTISGANYIQSHLDFSEESWYQILNWEEKRPFSFPCRVIPYRGYARSCFSASLMFRDKPVFRSGRMGFGFFSNKKHLDFCSGGSVFALIETIYGVHSKAPKEAVLNQRRQMNQEQTRRMQKLFRLAAILRYLELGKELNQGNCKTVAYLAYQLVTGDAYPTIDEAEREKWLPGVKRASEAAKRAQERRNLPKEADVQAQTAIAEDAAHD